MPTCGYEFYLLVFIPTSHSFAALTCEISSWTLEDEIHIHARSCNILYVSCEWLETQPSVYCLVSLRLVCLSLSNYCPCQAILSEMQEKEWENGMKIGPLEVQEIKEAKLMWIKSAQREAFPADICNFLTENLWEWKVAWRHWPLS